MKFSIILFLFSCLSFCFCPISAVSTAKKPSNRNHGDIKILQSDINQGQDTHSSDANLIEADETQAIKLNDQADRFIAIERRVKRKKRSKGFTIDKSQIPWIIQAFFNGYINGVQIGIMCWKRGTSDTDGTLSRLCPTGYFRNGPDTPCYKFCNPNQNFVWGRCWDPCPQGLYEYVYNTTQCIQIPTQTQLKKNIYQTWYRPEKKNYPAETLDETDPRITCQANFYKVGGFCYKDCLMGNGMSNCGAQICGDNALCTDNMKIQNQQTAQNYYYEFINIMMPSKNDFIDPTAQGVRNFTTQILGTKAYQYAFDYEKKIVLSETLTSCPKYYLQYMLSSLSNDFKTYYSWQLDQMCVIGMKAMRKSFENRNAPTTEFQVVYIDQLINAAKSCNNSVFKQDQDVINCFTEVFDAFGKIDLSGYITLARAFANPICLPFNF